MSLFGAAFGRQIHSFAQAYPGARDCTTAAMNTAIEDWFRLYFDREVTDTEDPCQCLPYTVVSKLSRSCFAEYRAAAEGGEPFVGGVLAGLETVRKKAMQLALIGGEAWLKPVPGPGGFAFTVMRRDMVTVLGRAPDGEVTALGSAELTMENGKFYTLLERRSLDEAGRLVIENRLFCSWDGQSLGNPVGLSALPRYAALEPKAVVGDVGGLGLVSLRLPLENCVDGSADPVSVYAAAAGLIHNINRNERQLDREFDHGESRVFASADLLDKRKNGRPVLPPGLFVGIDDDIANTGVTVFAPALRQESFLARKREYLRNVESLIGLKRGILGEVEAAQRTATEVTSSQGDYSLTIQELQQMWESAVRRALVLCGRLGKLYRLPGAFVPDPARAVRIDWGNGVLFDRDKEWAELMQLVKAGLLKAELALAWKYGLPAGTKADLARVRRQLMPGETAADNS